MSDESPLHKAVGRLSERLSHQNEAHQEQLDALGERILQRMDRIEARLARDFEQLDADTQREFREVRRDIGEMRDRLETVEGAAKVGTDAVVVATRKTVQSFWKTATGRAVKWLSAVAAGGAAITALPTITRFLERVWAVLRGEP